MTRARHASALLLVGLALALAGCTEPRSKEERRAQSKVSETHESETSQTKHSGWWCEEHGVPEHMCSLCSAKVAAKCKKEGDWCKLHDRAQSQCFKCDPARYARYEAMYEAKFGSKPPRPPEEEFQK